MHVIVRNNIGLHWSHNLLEKHQLERIQSVDAGGHSIPMTYNSNWTIQFGELIRAPNAVISSGGVEPEQIDSNRHTRST
jgi:hypothetical protein